MLSCKGIETCLENKQVGPDSKEDVFSLILSFDLFWVHAKTDKIGNCKAEIAAYLLWRNQATNTARLKAKIRIHVSCVMYCCKEYEAWRELMLCKKKKNCLRSHANVMLHIRILLGTLFEFHLEHRKFGKFPWFSLDEHQVNTVIYNMSASSLIPETSPYLVNPSQYSKLYKIFTWYSVIQ